MRAFERYERRKFQPFVHATGFPQPSRNSIFIFHETTMQFKLRLQPFIWKPITIEHAANKHCVLLCYCFCIPSHFKFMRHSRRASGGTWIMIIMAVTALKLLYNNQCLSIGFIGMFPHLAVSYSAPLPKIMFVTDGTFATSQKTFRHWEIQLWRLAS